MLSLGPIFLSGNVHQRLSCRSVLDILLEPNIPTDRHTTKPVVFPSGPFVDLLGIRWVTLFVPFGWSGGVPTHRDHGLVSSCVTNHMKQRSPPRKQVANAKRFSHLIHVTVHLGCCRCVTKISDEERRSFQRRGFFPGLRTATSISTPYCTVRYGR